MTSNEFHDTAKWADLSAQLREIDPIVNTASARAAHKVTAEIQEEARRRQSDVAAARAAAAYVAYAADAAAARAAAAWADAAQTPKERARIRSAARRPIVLATIAAFERAILITE